VDADGHLRGVGDGEHGPTSGEGALQDVEDLLGRLHTLRTGVVVRAEEPQREVCLRCEHEHEERRAELEVAAEQA